MSASWERITEVFQGALALDGEARTSFLRAACGDDAELLAEIESLLAHAPAEDDFLEPLVPPDVLERPERVGQHRIEGVLGRGAMGVVYAAREEGRLERRVALKVLRPGLAGDEWVERFERERRALARLSHPGIAATYAVGRTADGRPWFTLELVDGEPITHWCDRRRLDLRARVRLLLGVCDAVHHAHQKGLVHRDLKPSNVLVAEGEGVPRAKVLDFGVAKAMQAGAVSMTRDSRMLGTPEYMAPEQAFGASGADTRSDVFALGVLLCELVSGSLPMELGAARAGGYAAVQECVAWGERALRLPPPDFAPSQLVASSRGFRSSAALARALATGPAAELVWIVERALALDPDERYPSAIALARDLERFLSGLPVEARGSRGASTLYRTRKWARRHPWLAAGLVCVTLVLALGSALALVQRGRAERGARLARERTFAAAGFAHDANLGRERALRLHAAVLDLSLAVEIEDLAAQAAELWPAHPALSPRLDAWLVRADSKLGQLPRLCARLEAGALDPELDAIWWHEALRGVVEGLEQLVDPLDGLAHGRSARFGPGVAWRAARARERAARAASDSALWDDVRARLATHPSYAGLDLPRAPDLLPLGPDPESGLEEFALLTSGNAPGRDPHSGRLSPRALGAQGAQGALVFVLLPGGTAWIGAQASDPDGRHHDPEAEWTEGPVHALRLDPFYLAKTELTRAQWRGWTGEDPSVGALDEAPDGSLAAPDARPLDGVGGELAQRMLTRMGLALPTEARWEYAARQAQRFGLLAMDSGVTELCAGRLLSYDFPCHDGDGAQSLPGYRQYVVRGAGGRVSRRVDLGARSTRGIGVRPTRELVVTGRP